MKQYYIVYLYKERTSFHYILTPCGWIICTAVITNNMVCRAWLHVQRCDRACGAGSFAVAVCYMWTPIPSSWMLLEISRVYEAERFPIPITEGLKIKYIIPWFMSYIISFTTEALCATPSHAWDMNKVSYSREKLEAHCAFSYDINDWD